LLKLERSTRLLGRAHALEDTGHAAAALAAARRRVRALRLGLRARQRRMLESLDDVGELSAGGCGASRSAKVEAAYGGEHRMALSSVASDFAHVADEVYAAFYTLRHRAAAPLAFDPDDDAEDAA
jgi:hypothetical protein